MTDKTSLKPTIVLAVGAHPDDMDITASGSLAKYAANGAKIYYLIVTDGSKGSHDVKISPEEIKSIRQKEQAEAARIIKAEEPIFLNFSDGCLEPTLEVKKEIVRVIRQTKPDVVITMDPTLFYSIERGMINHPDHRAVGEAALCAVYPLARDHLAFPELLKEGHDTHRVTTVLLTNFEGSNYTEDISDFIDQKMAAIKAHKSQFADAERVSNNILSWNKANGSKAGYEYAESFKRIDLAF